MADSKALIVDVVIERPGGVGNRYAYDRVNRVLRLEGSHTPPSPLPGDLGFLADTLDEAGAPLPVLVLVAHPTFPGCVVAAQIVGAVVAGRATGLAPALLVAVPRAAAPAVRDQADLPPLAQQAFALLDAGQGVGGRWQDADLAAELVRVARRRRREVRLSASQVATPTTAWRPGQPRPYSGALARETAPHELAEYGLAALPLRFQQRVAAWLGPSERILFALTQPPPGQPSGLWPWQPRERATEGLLVLSSEQALLIADALPARGPDIEPFGYVARTVALERLADALVVADARSAALGLVVDARQGPARWAIAFPAPFRAILEEAVAYLRGYLPRPDDRRLRRLFRPEPLDLPPAPADLLPPSAALARLAEARQTALPPGESVLAEAYAPAWSASKAPARLLSVLRDRAVILADPGAGRRAARFGRSVPLADVVSLEVGHGLNGCWLALDTLRADGARERVAVEFASGAMPWFAPLYRLLRQLLPAARSTIERSYPALD